MRPLIILLAFFLCAFSPVFSTVTSTAGGVVQGGEVVAVEEGGGGCSDIENAVFDLSSSCSDSYSGSGTTWTNRTGDTDYNMSLANGPEFTGTAGSQGAHFLWEDGEYIISIKNDALPSFIDQCPQDVDIDCSFAFVFQYEDDGGGQILVSTLSGGLGMTHQISGGDAMFSYLDGGSNDSLIYGSLTDGQTYCVLISHNGGTDEFKYSINSSSFTTDSIVKSGTSSSTSVDWNIGSAVTEGATLSTGTKLYEVWGVQAYWGDSDISALHSEILTRTGINCTS